MNRILLGLACGVVFGVTDVLLTLFSNHPEAGRSMLLQAFFSRLAIGVLGANVTLGTDRIFAGAVAGLLISLPDAVVLHSYVGVLSTGIIFGAAAGWVSTTRGK